MVATNGALGRDSEVLWALWLLKELNCRVPPRLALSVAQNGGPLVLAFLAHMHVKGLAAGKLLVRELQYRVEGDLTVWAGHYWPLTLELRHLELWPSTWEKGGTDAPLSILHEARASLIRWDAIPAVFGDDANSNPDHAIEESTSYDDREDKNATLANPVGFPESEVDI
jgi:hypothetical protein